MLSVLSSLGSIAPSAIHFCRSLISWSDNFPSGASIDNPFPKGASIKIINQGIVAGKGGAGGASVIYTGGYSYLNKSLYIDLLTLLQESQSSLGSLNIAK